MKLTADTTLKTITVYEPDTAEVWYTFTGDNEAIQNEIDILDPSVEYSVEETA